MFEKEEENCVNEYRNSEDYCSDSPYDVGFANGLSIGFGKGANVGYTKATEWHYIKDQLPPEPAEENGSLKPLEYICAYKLNNQYDDFEIGEFLYLGNGEFMGENKNYPIYAWMDSPIIIPIPPEEK